MRHLKSGKKLNRNSSHRISMFRNMINSLIFYEAINTTLSKAKELRRFIEPLISISKIDCLSNRRLVFSRIRNKNSVKKLFFDLGKRFLNRNGGYIRIIKSGYRKGDNASMAYIEFVDRKLNSNK